MDLRPEPTPALEATSLVKRYGRQITALRVIDCVVGAGKVTALVGPNGAGKSTLMKMWVGFERPSAGIARVHGIDVTRHRRTALDQVAYVPQAPALYRELSVDEHLDLAMHYRPSFDRGLALRRLRDLAIPVRARAGSLSGGQAAQVGLALAVGTRAPILLLDEPLASLDPLARLEFLTVLREAIDDDGRTALLSSHVVSDIERGCDWLIVLGNGRKLLDSSLECAIAEHRVVDAATVNPGMEVGRLPGGVLRLIRDDGASAGRSATLEEVVLAYLDRGREAA